MMERLSTRWQSIIALSTAHKENKTLKGVGQKKKNGDDNDLNVIEVCGDILTRDYLSLIKKADLDNQSERLASATSGGRPRTRIDDDR